MNTHDLDRADEIPKAVERPSRQSYSYADELAIVEHLAGTLESELAGRNRPRIVNAWPTDVCQVCVLRPSLLVEDTTGSDTQKSEAGSARPQGNSRESSSSVGVEFLIEEDSCEIEISFGFSFYTRHFPSYEEQMATLEPNLEGLTQRVSDDSGEADRSRGSVTIADVFQRNDVSVPGIRFKLSLDDALHPKTESQSIQRAIDLEQDRAVASADAYRELDRTISIPIVELESPDKYEAFLASKIVGKDVQREKLSLVSEVRVRRAGSSIRVSCYLRNSTPTSGSSMLDNCRLVADARVRVSIISGTLAPIELLPVPKDYQYDRRVWCVGHGTSASVSENRKLIRSEGLGSYDQPRITTRSSPTSEFTDLSDTPLAVLENIRQSMLSYSSDWRLRILEENMLHLDEEASEQCRRDHDHFEMEIDTFSEGIAALASQPMLLEAFKGMNRVMERLTRGRYTGWRLFQIVFLVSQLPALALREGLKEGNWPDGVTRSWDGLLERADVLWFPTGGGKTEAYMGLISCACLFDRLRGKAFGTTAWLRFPLRMLSVQQLQRAMGLIWETEVERQQILGDSASDSDPISLGYFVGSTSTPNRMWRKELAGLDSDAADRLRVITDCPACKGKGTVVVSPDLDAVRAKHVCSQCGAELPVYVVDDEIYRFLPSLLVGTIDKLATIALQARFPMLWGAAKWRCKHHGFGFGSQCPRCREAGDRTEATAGLMSIAPYDPSPSLQIQDELHLLQEELGTFAGHYETLLRFCEQSLGKGRPKILAATATIEGYERHATHLYGCRSVARFPGRGYSRHRSYYTELVRAREDSDVTQVARRFLAVRPASMHHVEAAARCAEILLHEITQLYEHPEKLLHKLPTCSSIDSVRSLLVQYSTSLSYVGSLHNGARTFSKLQGSSTEIRREADRELSVEFHSGRSTISELADLIERTENPPPWSDESFLDAVIATDVISHGVDLERINLMVMDSVPEEIGRYIQISSRSGRTHVGLIIGVLPWFSKRASSIYHRFREFHANLEIMINPVPINRFAKYAINRTAPGVLAGIVLGIVNPSHPSDLRKRHYVAKMLEDGIGLLDETELLEAAAAAYSMGTHVFPEELESSFIRRLEEEVKRFRYSVLGSREEYLTQSLTPRPMTSLRDVEKGVPFAPEPGDLETALWFARARGGR